MPLRIIFTIAGLQPESGGPARSVPALCLALGRNQVEVEIVSLDYGDSFEKPLSPPEKFVRTTYVNCVSSLARQTQWTPMFKATLRDRCRTAGIQIVHDTGLWLLTNHAAASVSGELKLPRIVSPRGMLSAWALRYRGWKKRMAWMLYQHRDLARADVLHATSEAEAQEFRAIGLRQPVAVIPNGVEQPPPAVPISMPEAASPARTLLFLSRIHPKKGLMDLVNAWAKVRPRGWRVVIAGTDENNHEAEVKAVTRELGVAGDFSFPGAVAGDAKWNLYQQADVFVLPSHSENFGIVVAEALACGVPVITTRGTPWAEVVARRCGWWVDVGVEPLAAALREAIALPDDARHEMGRRGRRMVEEKFGWPGIAARMQAVYEWMLGRGAKPDCVTN